MPGLAYSFVAPGLPSASRGGGVPRSLPQPAPSSAAAARTARTGALTRPVLSAASRRLAPLGDRCPRVRLEVDLLQLLAREVRVHLRRRDVGVAEHLLHGS